MCVLYGPVERPEEKRMERERQGGGGGIDREVVYTHNNNTGLFF